MNITLRARYAAPLALALLAGSAQAAPFGFFDPRSAAMGGTGVSSADSDNASFLNPALLSLPREGERFAINLPIVSAHVAASENMLDDVDKLKTAANQLTDAINAFNSAQTTGNSQSLANAIGSLRGALSAISNKDLQGDLFAAPVTVAVPGKTLGVAVHAAARVDLGAQFVYSTNDDTTILQPFQQAAQQYATSGNPADLATLVTTYGTAGQLNDPNPNLQSRLNVRGLGQAELGVSFAHQFASLDNTAIGITPKQVKYYTFDYSVSPASSHITLDQGRKDYSGTNLDVGVAKDLGSGFRAGLVGKNMVKKTFDTALGNQIQLKPQYRAGISHHTDWTTIALDIDLTKNDPVGFDKATQYAAIGAEFDVLGWLQLRVGYRSDRTGNYKGLPSAGVGIALFKSLHIDAAIAARGKEEAMAAVQLGLRF